MFWPSASLPTLLKNCIDSCTHSSISPAQHTILGGLLRISFFEDNLGWVLGCWMKATWLQFKEVKKIIHSFTIQPPFPERQPCNRLHKYRDKRQGFVPLKGSQSPATEVAEKTAEIPNIVLLHEVCLWCYSEGWYERVGEGMLLHAQGVGGMWRYASVTPSFSIVNSLTFCPTKLLSREVNNRNMVCTSLAFTHSFPLLSSDFSTRSSHPEKQCPSESIALSLFHKLQK